MKAFLRAFANFLRSRWAILFFGAVLTAGVALWIHFGARGEAHVLPKARGAITALAFDANDSLLAVASADGQVAVWETRPGGKMLWRAASGGGPASTLAFAPAIGKTPARLVYASATGGVRIANAATGAPLIDAGAYHESGTPPLIAVTEDGAIWASAQGVTDRGSWVARLAPDSQKPMQAWLWSDNGTISSLFASRFADIGKQDGAPPGLSAVTSKGAHFAFNSDLSSSTALPDGYIDLTEVGAAVFDAGGSAPWAWMNGALRPIFGDPPKNEVWPTAELFDLAPDGQRFAKFSPDGKTIITDSAQGGVQVWDAATGKKRVHIPFGQTYEEISAIFTPDSQRILTFDGSDVTALWTISGAPLTLPSTLHGAEGIKEFSPDGTRLLTIKGKEAHVWEVATGARLFTLQGHTDAINDAHFSPDGSRIATASTDKTVRIWLEQDGALISASVFPTFVRFVQFHPDSNNYLAVLNDDTARIQESGGSSLTQPIKLPSSSSAARFTPDGRRVFFSSGGGIDPYIWDLAEGRKVAEVAVSSGSQQSAEMSPDGALIATAVNYRGARVWAARPCGKENRLAAAVSETNGKRVWFATSDGALCATGFEGQPPQFWKADAPFTAAAFAPGASEMRALVGYESGKVELIAEYNLSSPSGILTGHTSAITKIAVNNAGDIAAIGDAAGGVQIVRLGKSYAPRLPGWEKAIASFSEGRSALLAGLAPSNAKAAFSATPEARAANQFWSRRTIRALMWNLHAQGNGPGEAPGGAGFEPYWKRFGRDASDVVVAVIDTGIDKSHPGFRNDPYLLPGFDFVTDTERSVDGDGIDPDANDPGDICGAPQASVTEDSFHGTAISGVIRSIADVKLLPVRVIGRCGGTLESIVSGIRWAAGVSAVAGNESDRQSGDRAAPGILTGTTNPAPAQIINLSIGFMGACPESLQAAIDQARSAGAIVVTSAGSRKVDAANSAPANCKGVIVAGASIINGALADYSGWGKGVSLIAPGGDSKRDDNKDGRPDGVLSTKRSMNCVDPATGAATSTCMYTYNSGTDASAAHVAAALALLKQRFPDMSNDDLVAYLLKNAVSPRTQQQCSGACDQYPGATPIAGSPGLCFRPCGAGLLNMGLVR